ncbi:MAG: sulfatase-like hydrolase/transferase [Bacteroidetes bacterium]|nr:sulfatase-like hydrolase/transferase [Bacteroidota bacterium]
MKEPIISLLNRENIADFNHLMRYFKAQGYMNYRINAIPDNEKMKIPWTQYSNLYAIDEWIFFKSMNYKGRLYGFGPSPPDQFSLAYAHNYIKNQGKKPFTLFFITQSSHSPFISPDTIADNWEHLNEGIMEKKKRSVFFRKPTVDDYTKAIRYQIMMLTDYILKFGEENDVFILIGDHQPPLITNGKNDGFETPIHIICKNEALIKQFENLGFNRGLEITDRTNTMKHEGFYPIFMKAFLSEYGKPGNSLPVISNPSATNQTHITE